MKNKNFIELLIVICIEKQFILYIVKKTFKNLINNDKAWKRMASLTTPNSWYICIKFKYESNHFPLYNNYTLIFFII